MATCTPHSGAKKAHDWAVQQLADLFRTTHKVKTERVVRSRGQRCGDLEIASYLTNETDPSLNEAAADKIRKYRADYNNNPPSSVAFMPIIASTSGRLHSEFVRLLFLQAHRETDRFFAASGVQLAQSTSGQFHFKRAAFSSQLRAKVGNILAKAAALRITLNVDGAPVASRSHTHPSHSQTARLLTSSMSLGITVPRAT